MTTQVHAAPPRMSDQLNAGAISETTQTWKTIHTIHAPINSNKANMKWWSWRSNDIRGPCGPKASWHLSYRWGKPRKYLTQETFPDWGSNPCPLRDRRAHYRLPHSGGRKFRPYVSCLIPTRTRQRHKQSADVIPSVVQVEWRHTFGIALM